ncbi:unnamed protein product, partial [Mesorhabditis belari]|uniref:Uncharacterized protein n=1 Tax=Mesorhabditis belari TaxID=2138241 RepID=A0AAF3FBA1_9BILA
MKTFLLLFSILTTSTAIYCNVEISGNGGTEFWCNCGDFCLTFRYQGKSLGGCGCNNGLAVCQKEGWNKYRNKWVYCCAKDSCNK